MIIWGITANNHDASIAVFEYKVAGLTNNKKLKLLWAGLTRDFSDVPNDPDLNIRIIEFLKNQFGTPREIVFYEKPILKSLRQLWAGQGFKFGENNIKNYLKKYDLNVPIRYIKHHESHAAAGFYTSNFDDASVLVVDAIGEWNTVTIWSADKKGLKLQWSKIYPDSMGLFYTAFTHYLNLKPNEEEYILMGMSALGTKHESLIEKIKEDFFVKFEGPDFKLKKNLHKGCKWWERPDGISDFDIAACVQAIMEEYLVKTAEWMKQKLPSNNFVFMGGCALNCVANSLLAKVYQNIWIMPNPGDAGSAIGAVAAFTKKKLSWQGPYLGTDIKRVS